MFILISMADNTGTHRDLIKDTVHGRFISAALAPTSVYPGKEEGHRFQHMFSWCICVTFKAILLSSVHIQRAWWEVRWGDGRHGQIKEKGDFGKFFWFLINWKHYCTILYEWMENEKVLPWTGSQWTPTAFWKKLKRFIIPRWGL